MIIGITGGVGAGKSTVMDVLSKEFHVATILADDVARELQRNGGSIYQEIVSWLGEEIVAEDGEIDRQKLSQIVFANESMRIHLNEIVHPAVRVEILRRIKEYQKSYKHVAVEAALLIEEHYEDVCDEFWYVDASEEVRIKRLMQSRGYSKEKCLSIMQKQLSRDSFIEHCQKIIDNSKDVAYVKKQLTEYL